jgi:hypothetical protein
MSSIAPWLDQMPVFAGVYHHMPDLLTLREAAALLRLSERSL